MGSIGAIVGEGRTSIVRAFGNDAVIKIPKDHVPDEWLALEATYTSAARSVGAPAPEVRDVIQVEGRTSVVFARIDGALMWDAMRADPGRQDELVADMAALQRTIHRLSLPSGLPDLIARMKSKASAVAGLSDEDQSEAQSLIDELPRGAGVLHGDLHPGNVILSVNGPVAIDWFDASIGHPLADVLRSTLLMRPLPAGTTPVHLPGADAETLASLQQSYVGQFADVLGAENPSWQAAVAVSRLAEAADPEDNDLWDRWRARETLTS